MNEKALQALILAAVSAVSVVTTNGVNSGNTKREVEQAKRVERKEMEDELRKKIALENRLTAVESKAQKNWDLLYSVRSRLGME